MGTLSLLIISAYIGFSLWLGFVANKQQSASSEEYFLAGRSLSWVHLGFTLFATWMSTFSFLGAPGMFYGQGVKWFFVHGFTAVVSPLLMWFIGRRIWELGKQKGYITPADMLADIFQSETIRYLVAFISLLALVPYCLIQLVGIGKVLESVSNETLPYAYEIGVSMAAFGILVYTYLGGIKAIVWTDIIQALMFGILMLVGGGIALYAAGGLAGFEASLSTKPEAFQFQTETVGSSFSLVIIWTFGYVLLPHMWQRAYMAESKEALSKSIVLGSVMAMFLIILPCLLMGMLGIGFMSNLEDPDTLVPELFESYLPYLLPFVVLATFAAGMSTIDSQLLSASSVFVRDVLKETGENARARQFGRWIVVGLIGILYILALSPSSQSSIILLASKGAGIALLLLFPLLAALWWPSAGKLATTLGLIAGGMALLIWEIQGTSFPYKWSPAVMAILVEGCVLVGVASLQSYFRKT